MFFINNFVEIQQKRLRKRSSDVEEMTFYVAIAKNYGGFLFLPTNYYIYLTTLSDDSITYTITSSSGLVKQGQLSSSNPSQQITISTTYIVNTYGYADRHDGLRVHASGPVNLMVVNYQDYTIGEYPAIPYESFDTQTYEYYAVSSGTLDSPLSVGQILLVGNEDSTTVTVTPTVSVTTAANVQSNPSSYAFILSGQSKTFTLNEFQTLLVQGPTSSLDLTGSKITSNKPLTVVTGHQCGNIPSTTAYCENLMEQIPPTIEWGKQFMLSPYKTRSGQYYKIVASEASTTVKHKCAIGSSTLSLSSAGSFTTIQTTSGKYCYLEADKPIMVTQMSPSYDFDNVGDPAISVVPPMERYTKATSFFVPLLQEISTAYLNIVSKKKVTFYLDGSPLSLTWTSIVDIDGDTVGFGTQVTSVYVNTDHYVTTSDDVDFYGMFYGFASYQVFSLTTPGKDLIMLQVTHRFSSSSWYEMCRWLSVSRGENIMQR